MKQEEYDKIYNSIKLLNGVGGCSNINSHGAIFHHVLNIIKPKKILEIGFFCGGSASLFLEISDAELTSVDPINDTPTTDYLISVGKSNEIGDPTASETAVKSIYEKYSNRFKFVRKRSLQAALDGDLNEKYDLVFIDGDHWQAGVTIDLNIALALKIPYILLDDFNEMYDGVKQAYGFMKNKFDVISFYKGENSDCLLLKNKYI